MPAMASPVMHAANAELQSILNTLVYRLKRGPEELLSPLSNGNGMSPQPTVMTVDNDAKKVKLDQSVLSSPVLLSSSCGGRSRVVHLRNVPGDMTDVELVHLCISFGKITNFLLLKGKNQAFVEYEDECGAASLVNVSNTCPIAVRGRTIFCQYSNHQELKTDNKNAFNVVSQNSVPMVANVSGSGEVGATQQQPNSVLRVIIENMLYPVTLDILHTIFSRFGKVLRIITFSKNNTFQALIQFSEATAAQLGKSALDGQNVYNGCCTLRIDYSKLATLNVKYNNDKSRDYTNPNLPSGELTLEQQLGLAGAAANLFGAGGMNSMSGLTAAALQSSMQNSLSAASASMGLGGAYASLPQAAALQQAAGNMSNVSSSALGFSNPLGLSIAQAASMAATNQALGGMAGMRSLPGSIAAMALSPVVLVSNLHEEKVTPDGLFTLFGVYGDVQRVKILFNKKDNALIQYAEPAQAQLSIQHLDKLKLWGKQIRVASSKHMNVQMPKEGQPDAGLTKDYSQSPLHRFKKPGSKNYMNIYPPSSTLHLSNIPPNITEQFLMDAFVENNFEVKAFKFFPKDHKMALVQLASTEDAIMALMVLHNFKLAENAHLRVSFSKSGI